MWDRLTAPTSTVTLESTFRQPIRRPPRSACRFTCVSALHRLCVSSFPVGFSEDRVLRSGLASEALRVVLRGFVILPLLTQGQLYAFYLFFTTRLKRRWVSLTYHGGTGESRRVRVGNGPERFSV